MQISIFIRFLLFSLDLGKIFKYGSNVELPKAQRIEIRDVLFLHVNGLSQRL